MKRALFSQIKNDWKENIWLVVELLIVALVIWYLSMVLIRTYRNKNYPLGADIEDVYMGEVSYLDENGEEMLFFRAEDIEPETASLLTGRLQALIERVRAMPMVEAVAVGNNTIPFVFSFSGNMAGWLHEKDTIQLHVNTRLMTPEGVRVLKLQSTTGKSIDYLQQQLEKRNVLLGSYIMEEMEDKKEGRDLKEIIGKELVGYSEGWIVGDIIETIRRTEYEPHYYAGSFIMPLRENTPDIISSSEMIIRVKPGQEKAFEEAIRNDPAVKDPAFVSLQNVHPVATDRILSMWDQEVKTRTNIAGIFVLLAIVFIGLLGTFWYRVYLRTPEIAVRKTFGATDGDIFRRFISEALLLLSAALGIGIILVIIFQDKLANGILDSCSIFDTWHLDMILAGLITAAVMAIMIIIGVGIPARRAMHIRPAIALKEE